MVLSLLDPNTNDREVGPAVLGQLVARAVAAGNRYLQAVPDTQQINQLRDARLAPSGLVRYPRSSWDFPLNTVKDGFAARVQIGGLGRMA